MENKLHDIEWIERYLDRSLTPDEKKAMEGRLAAEPDFKSRVQEHHLLIEGIRYSHLHHKLEQLRALERAMPAVDGNGSTNQRWMEVAWKPLAAAAVFLIVTISYVLYNQRESPEALFATYFEAYPNVFEPTVRGNGFENERSAAFNAYDREDYRQAIIGFKALLSQRAEPGILLLLGNANLATGNVEEAQRNFLTLIHDFDELDGQAKWYLALTYLKQGQKEKAKLILQELGDPNAAYSKKAIEVLREVE